MALESIDFTKSGNDEEDLSSYFLQPSSSPYNIAEKVQQANFDLFNSNVEWTRKAKVKFKDELVSFEPDLTDDDVNSIESDHVLEDTSNPDSNFIDTANLEAHVQTTTDEKRTIPQFANEKAISDISEAADCSVDILEEIEEIQEEFEESCDYQTTLREEFIHIWESENSCKFEEDQLQFEEDLTEYRKNDSESTSTGDSKNIKTSKIESPPDKTEQKVTHRINTAENSHKKSKKGVRKDLRASEIRCKDHCIEKIDHSLSMSIKKLEIHEKSSINLPPLQLHQRNCCDNLKYSNTSRNLPKYNGYRSEYGLTIRQLKKRDRYMEIIKQKEVTRQKLMEEYRRLKIQQNEEVFCQWLKEITTRRRQQQFNKDSRSTSSSSGAVKSLTSPKIMNLPSDNKNISKADKNKQYSRPKTAGYNEFVPKTNAKRRRRPHTTNSCVYIEVPREILHKGIQIGDFLVANSKIMTKKFHILTMS